MKFENSSTFAGKLDKKFASATRRDHFHIPKHNGNEVIYLCGNSLGLQPKTVKSHIDQELKDWAELGVEGHFHAKNPWFHYHKFLTDKAAAIVGAKPTEVVIMNNLTVNLHLLMVSFYKPTKKQYKILMEASAFPSDQYAVESQVRFHGFDPKEGIIEAKPRKGESTIRTEDLLKLIGKNKKSLALVLLGGVNYYTGQAFEMNKIAAYCQKLGITFGLDLAHAAGNLSMDLHAWGVDFATWCTYKYLNSGPGGTSGVFVHERHHKNKKLPRFAGWWGYDEKTRFQMKKGFKPTQSAEGWQLSNAQILPMAAHHASLDIFDAVGIHKLREKSIVLTTYLEYLILTINESLPPKSRVKILTPPDPNQRGCQLSLVFPYDGKKIHRQLLEMGVVADWREPDVIRVAPVPLYNTFEEMHSFSSLLKKLIKA